MKRKDFLIVEMEDEDSKGEDSIAKSPDKQNRTDAAVDSSRFFKKKIKKNDISTYGGKKKSTCKSPYVVVLFMSYSKV